MEEGGLHLLGLGLTVRYSAGDVCLLPWPVLLPNFSPSRPVSSQLNPSFCTGTHVM